LPGTSNRARLAGASALGAGNCARTLGADRNQLEVVVRDRIFVFLTQKPLLDEDIDVRGSGIPVFAGEERNRMHVLLAAEHQLLFLLTLRRLLPDRHGDGHHDGHYRHCDQ
jgi:hypothetical protein